MVKIDMDIPQKCAICPFYMGLHGGMCLISEISYESHNMDSPEYKRQSWCPLIESEEE